MPKKTRLDAAITEAEEDLLIDFQFLVQGLMDKKGISRTELAKRAGVSKARLSQVLGAEANPTVKTFARLLHALSEKIALIPNGIEHLEDGAIEVGRGDEWRLEPSDPREVNAPQMSRSDKAELAEILRKSIEVSNDNYYQVITLGSDEKSVQLEAA